ncbi:MAG TPA: hypothetical protein VK633_06435 [Verrucomicrobiae bacterium]|nr:hypothetical protein [Verrucomicrobiae bacterium]
MKKLFGVAALLLTLTACTQSGENSGAYSKQGGGSMEGAGGAGPGYDGTGSGSGKHGTVPSSGAVDQGKTGNTQTNTSIANPSREKPANP